MAAPPRVTIAKPNRPNGVLSVPAAATQKKAPSKSFGTPSARLKLVIRRLPPGLTQTEFEEILGEDWKVGAGKASWISYQQGKISKDLSKVSRPSRAYLHLTQQEHINALSDKVRCSSINDSKGTSRDACLLGPPSVEFAPYLRVPNGKPRRDARQGTIDQDPEFMSFLESLTNPIVKPASVDQDDEASKAKSKVTMTPLVQYIKDKKASKGKEQAVAKATKAGRSEKENKPVESKSAAASTSSSHKRSASAAKVEKAARDAVKVLNKQAANVKASGQAQANPKAANVTPTVAPNSAANSALAAKQRERGNYKSAAAILQRDLGIGGSPRGRGGRNSAQTVAAKATPSVEQSPGVSSASAKDPQLAPSPASEPAQADQAVPATSSKDSSIVPPTAPAANRGPQRASSTSQAPKQQPPPSIATQAFLKHANPSQGITEPLLEEAFKAFGTVLKVEIDKKKGFAYVDFETPEELQKAIKSSPIKIAQGSVQVLERKTGSQLQAKKDARMSGPGNARGGGAAGGTPPAMGHGHHRGGSAMGSGGFRGGHVNNRGGLPPAGRGGHGRGRGGSARGNAHVSQGKGAVVAGSNNANSTASMTPTAPAAQTNASASGTPAG